MMRFLCLLFTLLFASDLAGEAMAETLIEQHHYLETVGNKSMTLNWCLFEAQRFKVRTSHGTEEDLTWVDKGFATWLWQFTDQTPGSDFRVERQGNTLKLSGKLRGKVIDRVHEIDDAPWFQTLSLSLRLFLKGSQKSIEFWSLRPTTLEVYKLRAVKKGIEEIEVSQKMVRADRVEIRLAGFGRILWKADYWFRLNDAVFIRYVGPSGPPGTPKTIVSLIRDLHP
ncbi:MAG TPA: hypothetical protein VJ974_08820 [Geopsychrobacteraceae bacterium]|nr:hypothetical protein [Geopsychrobacteraceae bacterium]